MIVTVFRNRLRSDANPEYTERLAHIAALAKAMPGFVATKTFVAEDGERCTIVEFADEPSHRAWATHAEHGQAKQRGREAFYSEYKIQVCGLLRSSEFKQG